MVNKQDILNVLQSIPDPEMPISIVDLGLIEKVEFQEGTVHIDLLPTFVGCLALPAISDDIKAKVGLMEGVGEVKVTYINDPPWNIDRITQKGREDLATHGIAVPDGTQCGCQSTSSHTDLTTSMIPCPWCGSQDTKYTSPFGPTRCRSIHFCNACRQPFERMKKV